MKSYTDLEQSKKLAEILPIESADMHYVTWTILENGEFEVSMNQTNTIESLQEEYGKQIIPCWSLAALLNVLPKIHKLNPLLDLEDCSIMYSGTDIYVDASNPIDACYELIIELHKSNLL